MRKIFIGAGHSNVKGKDISIEISVDDDNISTVTEEKQGRAQAVTLSQLVHNIADLINQSASTFK